MTTLTTFVFMDDRHIDNSIFQKCFKGNRGGVFLFPLPSSLKLPNRWTDFSMVYTPHILHDTSPSHGSTKDIFTALMRILHANLDKMWMDGNAVTDMVCKLE
jgi:hypothetical protein